MYIRHVILGLLASIPLTPVTAGMPTVERQAELRHLLKHDCGSCHGMTLRGGLGPALTPQALAGKSEAYLRRAIINGRPGTPMPPWRGKLSDSDVVWLVKYLLSCPINAKSGPNNFNCRPMRSAGRKRSNGHAR